MYKYSRTEQYCQVISWKSKEASRMPPSPRNKALFTINHHCGGPLRSPCLFHLEKKYEAGSHSFAKLESWDVCRVMPYQKECVDGLVVGVRGVVGVRLVFIGFGASLGYIKLTQPLAKPFSTCGDYTNIKWHWTLDIQWFKFWQLWW